MITSILDNRVLIKTIIDYHINIRDLHADSQT